MKKDIHPDNHRPVLFVDASNEAQFLISSTVKTVEEGIYKADGKKYPLFRVEITSASHPFYTGLEKSLDSAGRVEKFKARQASSKASPKKATPKTKK
ncbi:MAG: type B 50S ribosomal protein L31 [Candidatus Pacebacteria bacterium]|nr:type B 50S ribosomal protein L31 [Candidatus Paceibacterota bacterium]